MKEALLIDDGVLSRWLIVKAAERTYYGLDSEKPRLIEFIVRCLDSLDRWGRLYRFDQYL